jgi:hypothetical protein
MQDAGGVERLGDEWIYLWAGTRWDKSRQVAQRIKDVSFNSARPGMGGRQHNMAALDWRWKDDCNVRKRGCLCPQTNLGVDRMWSLEEGEFGCAAAPESPTKNGRRDTGAQRRREVTIACTDAGSSYNEACRKYRSTRGKGPAVCSSLAPRSREGDVTPGAADWPRSGAARCRRQVQAAGLRNHRRQFATLRQSPPSTPSARPSRTISPPDAPISSSRMRCPSACPSRLSPPTQQPWLPFRPEPIALALQTPGG